MWSFVTGFFHLAWFQGLSMLCVSVNVFLFAKSGNPNHTAT